MRHLLVVTSNIPPYASGGTPRLLRQCEFLPRQGWRVSVVGFSGHWQLPRLDPLPPPTKGYPVRVEARWHRYARRLKRICGLEKAKAQSTEQPWPDAYRPLLPRLLARVEAVVRKDPPDIVMLTVPSFALMDTDFLAGIHALVPGRIVLEQRDRFSDNLWHTKDSAGNQRAHALERAAGPYVAGVTEDSAFHLEAVKQWAPDALTEVISNGFVRERYVGKSLGIAWPGKREGVLRLQLVGRVYGHADMRCLIPGVRRALALRPELAKRLRLRIIGQYLPEYLGDWSEFPGLLELQEPIPYAEVPAAVERADVSLLVVVDSTISRGQPASKVFEYLGSSRPIFAVTNGAAAEIVRATQSGLTANPGDPEALAAAILKFDDQWLVDRPFPVGPLALRDPWEANAIAKKQAEFFERILAHKPSSPHAPSPAKVG